jgi:hypothetical protein
MTSARNKNQNISTAGAADDRCCRVRESSSFPVFKCASNVSSSSFFFQTVHHRMSVGGLNGPCLLAHSPSRIRLLGTKVLSLAQFHLYSRQTPAVWRGQSCSLMWYRRWNEIRRSRRLQLNDATYVLQIMEWAAKHSSSYGVSVARIFLTSSSCGRHNKEEDCGMMAQQFDARRDVALDRRWDHSLGERVFTLFQKPFTSKFKRRTNVPHDAARRRNRMFRKGTYYTKYSGSILAFSDNCSNFRRNNKCSCHEAYKPLNHAWPAHCVRWSYTICPFFGFPEMSRAHLFLGMPKNYVMLPAILNELDKPDDILQRYLLIEAHRVPSATMIRHGSEPTSLGDFDGLSNATNAYLLHDGFHLIA